VRPTVAIPANVTRTSHEKDLLFCKKQDDYQPILTTSLPPTGAEEKKFFLNHWMDELYAATPVD
jgi:uncharacterized protein YeaO (DUF488 family)